MVAKKVTNRVVKKGSGNVQGRQDSNRVSEQGTESSNVGLAVKKHTEQISKLSIGGNNSTPQLVTSPLRSRERILVYGQESTGKTTGAFDIALYTGPTIWYVDNDNTTERFIDSPKYVTLGVREEYRRQQLDHSYTHENGRLVIFHCNGWEDNVHALNQAWTRAERDDWIVIDSLSFLWDNVQSWYTEKLYHESPDEYFIKAREAQLALKDNKNHNASEAMFNEWQYINPVYTKQVTERIINQPCHLYMTAEGAGVTHPNEDKSVKDLYKKFGMKPKGQKRSGHNSHTVLYLSKSDRFNEEKYMMSTAKDREREILVDKEYSSMWEDYLREVAGW